MYVLYVKLFPELQQQLSPGSAQDKTVPSPSSSEALGSTGAPSHFGTKRTQRWIDPDLPQVVYTSAQNSPGTCERTMPAE